MLEHLNFLLCCFRVEKSHVGEEAYERSNAADTKVDTDGDKDKDAERYRSDPDLVGSTTWSSSLASRTSTESEGGTSRCHDPCPECAKLFRRVGRPAPRPVMDRLSLGSQHLRGLLVELEFGVKDLAAILPKAEKRFPGRFQDAARLRVTTTGRPETAGEENENNASDRWVGLTSGGST